jgi:hypothetical protein
MIKRFPAKACPLDAGWIPVRAKKPAEKRNRASVPIQSEQKEARGSREPRTARVH